MVLVSIDVEAANGVVATLRAAFDSAMDEWTAVGNKAASGLSSTHPMRALSDPLVLISDSARDLETRVELAIVYNTGGGAIPTSGKLEFTLPGDSDSIGAVKAQLGVEIAKGIEGLSPYGEFLDREDIDRFDRYTELLGKYSEDELVMNGLFEELGPEGIVQVPIMLKDFEETYALSLPGKSDDDLLWGDASIILHIEDLQQQLMESFGTGLATSTTSAAFQRDNPDLAADLVDIATRDRGGSGWGLSQILRYGDYDGTFLADVGAGLYEFEKDQSGPVWSPQAGGAVTQWRLGTDDGGAYFDPFVGLLEAMGRTPEGAADFFNPDNGGADAQERAKYLIEERTWRADDFNALGEALDAAATGFHSSTASAAQQEQSAWVASAAIHFLGERDDGPHDQRIGDAGKDSLGHLLAAYIVDVDRTANGANGGLGVFPNIADSPWKEGLPVGADFSAEHLRDVMAEVLTDATAVREMADASNAWNGARIGYAAEHFTGEGAADGGLQVAMNQSSTLNGFVVGVTGVGLEDEAKQLDERAQQYIDLTSDLVGLVPTGGTFTSFLADQALSAGKDAAGDQWTGNESRVKDEQHTVQQVAYTDLQIAMAVALAENDKLDASDMTYEVDGVERHYAWFSADGFDGDSLADPLVRNQFISWIGSLDAGTAMGGIRPDVAAMFEAGYNLGAPR